jgi:HlyD family secretion protein
MTQRRIVLGLLLLAAVLVAALVLAPRFGRTPVLSGYVEGEPLYLAAPTAGRLASLAVDRGDAVKAGAALFVLDPQQPQSQRDQAAAELSAARAQARDARQGQRPVELAVLDAQVAQAAASNSDRAIQFRRMAALTQAGVRSQSQLDDARAAAQTAAAELAAARRRREAAGLGVRQDQVQAADARVAQARAALAGAQARLGDVSPRAPAAALVEEVFYRPGEWVAANQPILSLLPDDRIKLRFFAPERSVAAYRVGRTVSFACDGCGSGLTAKITFVSRRPEFTPPVIYSREARDRLVYLIEAQPSARLHPGQPVDVTPLEPGA